MNLCYYTSRSEKFTDERTPGKITWISSSPTSFRPKIRRGVIPGRVESSVGNHELWTFARFSRSKRKRPRACDSVQHSRKWVVTDESRCPNEIKKIREWPSAKRLVSVRVCLRREFISRLIPILDLTFESSSVLTASVHPITKENVKFNLREFITCEWLFCWRVHVLILTFRKLDRGGFSDKFVPFGFDLFATLARSTRVFPVCKYSRKIYDVNKYFGTECLFSPWRT